MAAFSSRMTASSREGLQPIDLPDWAHRGIAKASSNPPAAAPKTWRFRLGPDVSMANPFANTTSEWQAGERRCRPSGSHNIGARSLRTFVKVGKLCATGKFHEELPD
jgi:hypothetical protein